MYLGKTQTNALIIELKINNREDIIKDIEKYGINSYFISCTDSDNQQFCIKLSSDVFIYSQQNKMFYSWDEDNDIDVMEYYTDTIYLNDEEDIDQQISGFYDSVEDLKSEVGDDWKQIVAECIFEYQAMA